MKSTISTGNTGDVIVVASTARLDGQGFTQSLTGITTQADSVTGNAGSVTLHIADLLEILNVAEISNGTLTEGNAGNVTVHAGKVLIEGRWTGITSAAAATATGQVRNLDIYADHIDLRHGGRIAMEAHQTLPAPDSTTAYSDNRIAINADRLVVNHGLITTESTGNVPAAAIYIDGAALSLKDGRITTSAEGRAASAGNIHLSPTYLILDGGFIQANAVAADARGENIMLQVHSILQDPHAKLRIGGSIPEIFTPGGHINIIQAAAPQGNPGEIPNVPIQIDLSGALAPAPTHEMVTISMAEDYCRMLGTQWASTLVLAGRGGLPEGLTNPLLIFLAPELLDTLLQ